MLKKINCALLISMLGLSLNTIAYALHLIDKESLQKGAALYVNYCLGCHSLQYMRYSQMAQDIGLVDDQAIVDINLLMNNLLLEEQSTNQELISSLPQEEGRQWFGHPPPDLSLIVKVRGTDWLSQYLNGFYPDPNALWGSNNHVLLNTAMPDVLTSWTLEKRGSVTQDPVIKQQAISDIIYFLSYVGEPNQTVRFKSGIAAVSLLLILLIIIILIKRSYWKDKRLFRGAVHKKS